MSEYSQPPAGPVAAGDRIDYLDILRGFAVMAIFIVNIKGMVMPFAYYANPSLWATEFEQGIATVQKYLVDDKWRTTFTALYGAGLLMIWDRLKARGEGRGLLLKRNLWLLFFGAFHLILIWMGDILFAYGLTGLLAMLFVRMKAWQFFVVGLPILALGSVWLSGFMALPAYVPDMAAEMKPLFWAPTEDSLNEEIAAMGGGVLDQIIYRAMGAIGYIFFYMLFGGGVVLSLGLMVVGMGLFRSGLYRGTWPLAITVPLAAAALGAAWYLDYLQITELKASGYDFFVYSKIGWMSVLDGYLGAFGYACLISALVSLGIKFGAVAAVGRMAFTNYITCSLIGTTMAGGHALGMFGDVSLTTQMIVVGVTFVGMLIWSPLWLRVFRFGPLEWLWRSLVYGQLQPMRRAE
ncbi:MAG: DUF418 domain-containing protein [Pseudomonadota bacterium]